MKKQWVLIVAAVVVAGVVGLIAWIAAGSGPAVEAASLSSRDGERPASPAERGAPAPVGESERTAPAAETPANTAPSSSPQAPIELAEGEGLDVLVLDKKTEEPVAGAKLTYVVTAEGSVESLADLVRHCTLEELLAASGASYRVDDHGRARVPEVTGGGAIVAARAGDLWGYAVVSKTTDPPLKVLVARDADVQAIVVDGAGQPVADALVSLRVYGGNGRWSYDVLETRTRAPDGLAVLEHAGANFNNQDYGGDTRWAVALGAVLEKPVEVAIAPNKLPAEPVKLVVPPTGECEVLVVDPDGKPYTDNVTVSLRMLTREEELTEIPDADEYRDVRPGASIEIDDVVDGRALFRHVQAGVSLEAAVQRHGNYQQHIERGPGPSSVGSRASITVRLGANRPMVAGRAVDEHSVPLADAKIHAKLSYVGQRWFPEYSLEMKTDATGRFMVDLIERGGDAVTRELTVYTAGDDGVELTFATREISSTLGPGLHELGDFVLQPSPVLLSGRVVDEQGKPVKHAWITPSVKQTWSEEDSDSFWWQDLWNYRCQSDAQGKFALRGRLESREIGLRAEADKLKSDVVTALPGATDVVLRLIATGEIAGQVLLDPGVAVESLQMRASPAVETPVTDQQFQWPSPASIDEQGKFLFKDLRAGVYTIALQTVETNTQLGAVENVRVDRGQITRDPRLNPLDLRGGLHPIVLTILNELGEPVTDGNVGVRKTGDPEGSSNYEYFERGKLVVFLPGGQPVDLTVMADGYRGTSLHNVAIDQQIQLKRMVPLRFVVARGLHLPRAPFTLGVHVEAGEQNPRDPNLWEENSADFEPSGEVSIPCSIVGQAKVTLTITFQDDDNWNMTNYTDELTRTIVIADTQLEQRFEISFDEAKVDQQARALLPEGKRDG